MPVQDTQDRADLEEGEMESDFHKKYAEDTSPPPRTVDTGLELASMHAHHVFGGFSRTCRVQMACSEETQRRACNPRRWLDRSLSTTWRLREEVPRARKHCRRVCALVEIRASCQGQCMSNPFACCERGEFAVALLAEFGAMPASLTLSLLIRECANGKRVAR